MAMREVEGDRPYNNLSSNLDMGSATTDILNEFDEDVGGGDLDDDAPPDSSGGSGKAEQVDSAVVAAAPGPAAPTALPFTARPAVSGALNRLGAPAIPAATPHSLKRSLDHTGVPHSENAKSSKRGVGMQMLGELAQKFESSKDSADRMAASMDRLIEMQAVDAASKGQALQQFSLMAASLSQQQESNNKMANLQRVEKKLALLKEYGEADDADVKAKIKALVAELMSLQD